MARDLHAKLAAFGDGIVKILDPHMPLMEAGDAPIRIEFANGTRLNASYWRLTKQGKAALSSFDDRQKYGLPAPIDARAELRRDLDDRRCASAQLEEATGDLVLDFAGDLKLQVFNFTGYEIWDITFPDGTGQYSNYVLEAD